MFKREEEREREREGEIYVVFFPPCDGVCLSVSLKCLTVFSCPQNVGRAQGVVRGQRMKDKRRPNMERREEYQRVVSRVS